VTTPSAPRPPIFRTLPGRLFILTSILLGVMLLAMQFTTLSLFVDTLRKVTLLGWIVSVIALLVKVLPQQRRRFLWRVRRKLILSYVFLGFVPVLLIVALTVVFGLIMYLNLAGYMFNNGLGEIRNAITQSAETAATELSLNPSNPTDALRRRYNNLASKYPALSLAVIPLRPEGGTAVSAGAWRHTPAPTQAPPWLASFGGGFRGIVAVPIVSVPGEWMLVLRTAIPTTDGNRAVLVDLPINEAIVTEIEARSQTRMEGIAVPQKCGGPPADAGTPPATGGVSLFKRSTASLECRNWETGDPDTVVVGLHAPFARLYARLTGSSQTSAALEGNIWVVVSVLGFLFILIQGSALLMGGLLARTITYAVHELFQGTERVQQGDFTHRIKIDTGDQLGDLANSFNRMSSSIEHLLHVQREKQRLDDELRIARDIQKSLLPAAPPAFAGLGIADLCEPAREVGGDYYDFFELGPGRLGVMVADVSGKGTSAALYMAELKGLMLALSRREHSPRRLLIEANRMLAEHLDNRSFITMTYAVIDLNLGQMTCARAGHTPMIVASADISEVVTPSGMVLGLRLPNAAELFESILEEHTRPIAPGDVIVLYTDGITEAMNDKGDLFTDEALAKIVQELQHLDAAEIRERVVREVRAFVGDLEPHDDMTMIVLKLEGMRES